MWENVFKVKIQSLNHEKAIETLLLKRFRTYYLHEIHNRNIRVLLNEQCRTFAMKLSSAKKSLGLY